MKVFVLYQNEWNRLLEEAEELIQIVMKEDETSFELQRQIQFKDVEEQNECRQAIKALQLQYLELSKIAYYQLKQFKDKAEKVSFEKGKWKENAMLFIIANAFQKKRMPLYLKPSKLFSEETLKNFYHEMEEYLDTETYRKYIQYVQLGFVYYQEEEYIKDLIIPC